MATSSGLSSLELFYHAPWLTTTAQVLVRPNFGQGGVAPQPGARGRKRDIAVSFPPAGIPSAPCTGCGRMAQHLPYRGVIAPHFPSPRSSRNPRSGYAQEAAGFFVAGFQIEGHAQVGVQPDRQRRQRLAEGQRVEPGCPAGAGRQSACGHAPLPRKSSAAREAASDRSSRPTPDGRHTG